MKKTLLIAVSALLLSCSKQEIKIKSQGKIKYSLNGYTDYNTKLYAIKHNSETNYIQYSFKINDSMIGAFVLSTENEIQYCHSNIITQHFNGRITEQIIDYKMIGRYYVTNVVVDGVFTGSGINFIDFTNYNLYY